MIWLILAVYLLVRGIWLIPSSYSAAKNVQAPYRALRGALYVVIGLFDAWLALRGTL